LHDVSFFAHNQSFGALKPSLDAMGAMSQGPLIALLASGAARVDLLRDGHYF